MINCIKNYGSFISTKKDGLANCVCSISYFLRSNYHLTVCYCHVTYAFQSESTLYNCLNVKELLARSWHKIWSLNDWVFVYDAIVPGSSPVAVIIIYSHLIMNTFNISTSRTEYWKNFFSYVTNQLNKLDLNIHTSSSSSIFCRPLSPIWNENVDNTKNKL